MHDRANILISPSSLGRLVVLAYLHWRVANATNLNRVGNIGLHQGCELSMQLKNQTKIFCCCFILFFFIIYIIYLSLFLCYSSCLWPFVIIVWYCILFIFVYRSVLFICVIYHFYTYYMLLSIVIYFSLLFIFFNYYLSLFDITFHYLFLCFCV